MIRERLEREIIPEHYDLYLDVAFEEKKYKGEVTMHLVSNKPTNIIKFNSKQLELLKIHVIYKEKDVYESFTEENEFVTVVLKEDVVGKFLVTVEYTGIYTNAMDGFYKSEYNGKDLYSTHFEPSDARKAFPCFDQPDLKATFNISIKTPPNCIALSNNDVKEIKDGIYVFNKTPCMPTYIVAWVVGDLKYIEDKTDTIPIRIYADESETKWGELSLEVAKRCLKYFEKYFGIKYPLPKLDLVAIPAFAMGAMENWGLVTFRTTSLLYDPKSTSMRAKKNIVITVCHELAHMWFGNLVTMDWWDDLWLNEGFATWAATLAIENSTQDVIRWDAWTSFINDDVVSGLERDSLNSTHRIEVNVSNPVEVGQIFDEISYSKGASIIKMLENWLGHEIFREGLGKYLQKYSYGNTVTVNLWDSLSEASGKNVAEVIQPWTNREGFPFLTVVDNGKHLEITQSRFSMGHNKVSPPWPIPIRILWSEGEESMIMAEKTITVEKKSEFYKINNMVSGFYRVLYPEDHLGKLFTNFLNKLEPENRLNLFSDQFAMIMSLRTSLGSILPYMSVLKSESNYEVMFAAVSGLISLRSAFYFNNNAVKYFNNLILSIVDRVSTVDLSNPGKDVETVSMNSYLVALAVNAGDDATIERLKKDSIDNIHHEFYRSYYTSIVDDEFSTVLKAYKESKELGKKQAALFALGTAVREESIRKLFTKITEIKPQDSPSIFRALGLNLNHRNLVAELFISQFNAIREHISDDGLIRLAIESVLDSVIDDSMIEKIYNFLDSIKQDKELKSSIDKCYDSLTILTLLKKEYQDYKFE